MIEIMIVIAIMMMVMMTGVPLATRALQKDPLAKRFGAGLRGRSVFQRALDCISHRANAVRRKQSFSMGAEYFRDPTDIRGDHRHSRRAGLYYDVGH